VNGYGYGSSPVRARMFEAVALRRARSGAPEAEAERARDEDREAPQIAFLNRTAFHEPGQWTGSHSRLCRDSNPGFGSPASAREELVAEMASAFACAALSIRPTLRHADYIAGWLRLLREDDRAIFRAASQASKAANLLLGVGAKE
jgi:antirestriction protein ArdC